MTELLAPAGSLDSLCAAVNAGADAVYIGGSRFGARAYANNPDEEDLLRGIEFCHLRGKKIYLTVNTLLKQDELFGELIPWLRPYYENGIDALIIQDTGALRFLHEAFPDLELHASTQMSITSPEGAMLLWRHGVTRIVPARELTLPEVRALISETGMEAETFIHGAMCYSYSGRCLLSSLIGGRSGNRGRCAQPCRLPYTLEAEIPHGTVNTGKDQKTEILQKAGNRRRDGAQKNPDTYRRDDMRNPDICRRNDAQRKRDVCRLYGGRFGEDAGAGYASPAYLLSMKDLCTLDFLPELAEAGISSFKIEGRMKSPEYTAGVVEIYRKYLDLYERCGRAGYRVRQEDRSVLLDLFNRGGFSGGYYRDVPGPFMISAGRPGHLGTQAARLKAVKGRRAEAIALEPLHRGDVLELSGGAETVLQEDTEKGAAFTFALPEAGRGGRKNVESCADRKNFSAGMTFYRTKNESLQNDLARRFLAENSPVKIKGRLRISAGSPAILRVWLCGEKEDGRLSFEAAENLAVPARTRAVSAEEVRRQIRKTGGTPFEFENLYVELEDALFVPVRALNELRRAALLGLQERILEERRRRKQPGAADAGLPEAKEPERIVRKSRGCISGDKESCAEGKLAEKDYFSAGCADRVTQCGGIPSGALYAERQESGGNSDALSHPRLTVLVTTPQQLLAIVPFSERYPKLTDTVYLDEQLWFPAFTSGAYKRETGLGAKDRRQEEERIVQESILTLQRQDTACFLACPPALRSRDRELFLRAWGKMETCSPSAADDPAVWFLLHADGFLVQSIDQLSLLKRLFGGRAKSRWRLAAEDSLYTMNTEAVHFFSEEGIGRFTLPAELNYQELLRLSKQENFIFRELPVYGYQPLMQSAQCLRKNTGGCIGKPEFFYLKDRRGAHFPVLNRCSVCCNTIYNSVPLDLSGCREEIKRLSPGFLRLSFGVETGDRTHEILAKYAGLFSEKGKISEAGSQSGGSARETRGHFKRGVE